MSVEYQAACFVSIVDLTFRITTCRSPLAIAFRTWDLVCINLSFASRDFVCPRMTSIRIAWFVFVHRRGHHAFRKSSFVSLAHGQRWLFLSDRDYYKVTTVAGREGASSSIETQHKEPVRSNRGEPSGKTNIPCLLTHRALVLGTVIVKVNLKTLYLWTDKVN